MFKQRKVFWPMSACVAAALLSAILTVPAADPPAKAPDTPVAKPKHGRGLKLPPLAVREAQHKVNAHRHKAFRSAVPVTTLASYDARPTGTVPPVGDQGQCGDCYMWSGCKACSNAQMAAGVVKADGTFMLSVQYMLDYYPSLGGCDGGDEFQVAQTIHSGGCPNVVQYPGAGQGPQKKQPLGNDTIYTVSSIVMVGSDSGVAATQDIKNYIAYTGYVSVAADASSWDNVGANTTITGNGTDIDHAIGLVGWDDSHDNGDGSKGAWIVQNQWGTSWGNNGYAWIKYGADSIGTEAFICIAGSGPTPPSPPSPPTPVPPTPVPPVPPSPVGTTTITLTPDQVAAVLQQNNGIAINDQTTLGDLFKAIKVAMQKHEEKPASCK